MKVGFGQQKKKTHKKQKKKDKKNKDGDDTMVDAQPTVRPSPEQTDMTHSAPVASAKDKQRQRMELKNALKVQVASLKNKRNKLTKLAGNRTERRQLNTELKGLVQEQVSQKKGKKGKQPEQPAAGEDVMAE